MIAEFLIHNFQELQQQYNTLVGYRTVICATIEKVTGVPVADEQHLSSLLNQFAIERPPCRNRAPPWDLALVLRVLHFAPFEPLATAPLWALTYKTVFLTALATAKRRGEIHAFLARIQRTENWSQITLIPDPIFVAKTERAGKPETRLQEVTIKSLREHVGPDLPVDANNCVVRAVKIYLARTKAFRRNRTKLFISYQQTKLDDIKPVTISNWLVKTVRYAYDTADGETRQLYRVRAHDVRGMAVSWSAAKMVRVGDILKAAQWRSHNTFTSFYLMDMTVLMEDMYQIGPLVTAQSFTNGAS